MNTADVQKYAFDNECNYKYKLSASSRDIFNIYTDLMKLYIKEYITMNYTDAIYISNPQLYYYLFIKGASTIGHIFKIILKYTKNTEFTEHYCIKSIHYYIEFLYENNDHDERKIDYNHASLFLYVNSIYNLKKTLVKSTNVLCDETKLFLLYDIEKREVNVFKNLEHMINLYQKILECTIAIYNTDLESNVDDAISKESIYEYIDWNIDTLVDYILHLSVILENSSLLEDDYMYKLNFITDFLEITNITSISLIYILIREVKNREPTYLNKIILLKKIMSDENKVKLETETSNSYIEWLLL